MELSLARADGTSTEIAGSIEGYQANPISLSGSFRNIRVLFSQRTYLLLFFRSALDGIPMNANALLILWFEYMGYSEARASSLVAILLLSNCVSSVTFGIIGDEAHRRFPGRGRIFTAMITLLFQIVATVSLFGAGDVVWEPRARHRDARLGLGLPRSSQPERSRERLHPASVGAWSALPST